MAADKLSRLLCLFPTILLFVCPLDGKLENHGPYIIT
jgi:hypothetical protein